MLHTSSSLPPLDPLLIDQYHSEPTTPLPRQKRKRAWKWVKDARSQVWADIRTADYRRGSFWLLLLCWEGILLSLIVIIPLYTSLSQYNESPCRPDGSFSVLGNGYNPWFMTGFFQITLGFGPLSFTQAKVIDIVWDIVCHII